MVGGVAQADVTLRGSDRTVSLMRARRRESGYRLATVCSAQRRYPPATGVGRDSHSQRRRFVIFRLCRRAGAVFRQRELMHIPWSTRRRARRVPDPLPQITELLAAARGGDEAAGEAVARAVHDELRALAASYLRRERPDHTLQPTALVHEAYLRMLGQSHVEWRNRSHFFGIAAQAMRRLLVDHARRNQAARRDAGVAVTLDDGLEGGESAGYDVLGVHEALNALAKLDPRQAQIVELKFFVGLSLDEIAEVLDVSVATVSREWAMARAWLQQELAD